MADPVARFRSWFRQAARAGAVLPEAMVLATADHRGRPSARYVLLKDCGPDGFVFYTNADSRKGREMAQNPYVALVFYWEVTGRQVRVEGKLRGLDAKAADAYWQERPPGSRIASAVSEQSRPIESRAALMARYRDLARQHPDGNIARPSHWRGFLVVPDAIEFWERAEPRMHKRELFTRTRSGWTTQTLQP
ncbi:MAG TPA: pyridoxamine 5'-phosphate oxidase [Candidatus Binatia bacterium]|nr:pyridoxamine 5'-phosphate oxidase [Candidatus Binatia bacterium]